MRAVLKISSYTCEEKKWAFDLHMKTLQLGYYKVKARMPSEWQVLTWENFPAKSKIESL